MILSTDSPPNGESGNRKSVTYPNGVITTYAYDKLNRLVEMASKKGSTVLSSYTYTLAPNGKRLTMTEHTGRKSTYAYDKNDRLIGESISDVLNGNRVTAYTYDKVGNRQQQVVDGTTTAYTYNANDWIQSAGTVKYTYDANGNTLTETDAGNVTTYVYDKRNKLVKATTPSDTVTYQYAPNGLRTQQVVGGVTTDYLVDSQSGYGDVVTEYQNDVKQKTYTIGDDLISQTMGTNTLYFGYDGLGSTRMLFDDSASVTDTYDYTAFGEIHGQTGSTDNAYQFTGEQYDNTLGQYYLRARYYNQAIGRFTQLDTYQGQMSDPASLHKYLYTANDPVNMIDPTGHMSLMSIEIAQVIQGSLRTANIGSKINKVRKIAAKICKICAKFAGKAVVAAKKLEEKGVHPTEILEIFADFQHKNIKKITKGTGYHSHHVFQDSAAKIMARDDFMKYRTMIGLAIPLFGNNSSGGAKKGSMHYFANLEQKDWMERLPRDVAFKSLRAGGCSNRDATTMVESF